MRSLKHLIALLAVLFSMTAVADAAPAQVGAGLGGGDGTSSGSSGGSTGGATTDGSGAGDSSGGSTSDAGAGGADSGSLPDTQEAQVVYEVHDGIWLMRRLVIHADGRARLVSVAEPPYDMTRSVAHGHLELIEVAALADAIDALALPDGRTAIGIDPPPASALQRRVLVQAGTMSVERSLDSATPAARDLRRRLDAITAAVASGELDDANKLVEVKVAQPAAPIVVKAVTVLRDRPLAIFWSIDAQGRRARSAEVALDQAAVDALAPIVRGDQPDDGASVMLAIRDRRALDAALPNGSSPSLRHVAAARDLILLTGLPTR